MSFKGYKIDAIDIKDKSKGDPVFFKTKYSNCCLVSKKRSGKTNMIYHIMRNIVGQNTDIYIFCSTARRDKTWIQMIEELKKKGNNVVVYDGLYDTVMNGKRRTTVNNLKQLMDSFKEEEGEEENKKEKKKKKDKQEGGYHRLFKPYERNISWDILEQNHPARRLFPNLQSLLKKENKNAGERANAQPKEKRKTKSRKLFPEKILILDDLSDQIKDPIIPAVLKVNRHYKMVCLLSTQFPNDIRPSARSQFNQLFTWKGHSPQKVEVLRRMCDTNLDEDEFYELYKEATAEPYGFMYCDIDDGKIYKNFDNVIYE